MRKYFFILLQGIGIILFNTGCSKVGDPVDEDNHVIDHSDNIFPVLVVNKPANNQVLNNGDTIFVEGMVSDEKTMYRGRIKISDDGNGFVVKEEFFETHILQTINFNIFYKANVSAMTDYTVLVEFEDHGLNKVYVTLKVKVNP